MNWPFGPATATWLIRESPNGNPIERFIRAQKKDLILFVDEIK
jgi:hypothetical protein